MVQCIPFTNVLAFNFPITWLKHKASSFVYLPILCLLKSTRHRCRSVAAKRHDVAATRARIPLEPLPPAVNKCCVSKAPMELPLYNLFFQMWEFEVLSYCPWSRSYAHLSSPFIARIGAYTYPFASFMAEILSLYSPTKSYSHQLSFKLKG